MTIPRGHPDGPVVARMERELDAVADRLGALYQLVGRLDFPYGPSADERAVLDEIIALTNEVERISGRNNRQ